MKYNKVIIVTPAFCNWKTLFKHFELIPKTEVIDEQWVLLNHYPQEDNTYHLARICKENNINYFDNEFDRGLHGSLNNFFVNNPQPSRTFMIQIDPDIIPPKGFDKAMLEVMEEDNNIAIISLHNCFTKQVLGERIKNIAGHQILYPKEARAMSIYGIDLDFIISAGGFNAKCKYWGSLELDFQTKTEQAKKKIAFILDVKEEPNQELRMFIDNSYINYKFEHGVNFNFEGSYEEYLKEIKQ
jgi:hypothetical protein